jgi:hypothetical protein
VKFTAIRFAAALALLLALSGCSNDDNNSTNPPGTTTIRFVGTVNGLDGVLSGSITFTVTNNTAVTGTFRITSPAASSHNLAGTYDDSSKALAATGDGYNFGGVYDEGSGHLDGAMTGNATGLFAAIRDDDNTSVAYCGTFAGADDGTWNFTIEGNTLYGSYMTSSSDTGVLEGTISGNAIVITEGGLQVATGTRNGDNVSGTWDAGQGNSGTWTGSRCN